MTSLARGGGEGRRRGGKEEGEERRRGRDCPTSTHIISLVAYNYVEA